MRASPSIIMLRSTVAAVSGLTVALNSGNGALELLCCGLRMILRKHGVLRPHLQTMLMQLQD